MTPDRLRVQARRALQDEQAAYDQMSRRQRRRLEPKPPSTWEWLWHRILWLLILKGGVILALLGGR